MGLWANRKLKKLYKKYSSNDLHYTPKRRCWECKYNWFTSFIFSVKYCNSVYTVQNMINIIILKWVFWWTFVMIKICIWTNVLHTDLKILGLEILERNYSYTIAAVGWLHNHKFKKQLFRISVHLERVNIYVTNPHGYEYIIQRLR